nr:SbcC/MukB-like Walker B domain-containing protein [Motilibacter aurantiacus]
MSGGRYSLVHTDVAGGRGRAGLGLSVLDAWTGAERDPATLSGGEAFMASLALALGLSDVVTAEAGGVLMETLFVDEGFGALDEETLDEVLDVLDGLREGGRVVGLVSHVSELRARIPAQVLVAKGRSGSTVGLSAAVQAHLSSTAPAVAASSGAAFPGAAAPGAAVPAQAAARSLPPAAVTAHVPVVVRARAASPQHLAPQEPFTSTGARAADAVPADVPTELRADVPAGAPEPRRAAKGRRRRAVPEETGQGLLFGDGPEDATPAPTAGSDAA